MNDGLRLFCFKYVLQTLAVPNVDLVEGNLLAGDGFDTPQHLFACIVKIIQNHRLMPCILQLNHRMTSNETGTACYQDLHLCFLPEFFLLTLRFIPA